MDLETFLEKHVRAATINQDEAWVRARAQEVDPTDKRDLFRAGTVGEILLYMIGKEGWEAASSSNVRIEGLEYPVRVIVVPNPSTGEFETVINPEMSIDSDRTFRSMEGCGSIPGELYHTERNRHVTLRGYTPSGEERKLRYGPPLFSHGKERERMLIGSLVVQHEIDHLNGRLISDHGALLKNQPPSYREKMAIDI